MLISKKGLASGPKWPWPAWRPNELPPAERVWAPMTSQLRRAPVSS